MQSWTQRLASVVALFAAGAASVACGASSGPYEGTQRGVDGIRPDDSVGGTDDPSGGTGTPGDSAEPGASPSDSTEPGAATSPATGGATPAGPGIAPPPIGVPPPPIGVPGRPVGPGPGIPGGIPGGNLGECQDEGGSRGPGYCDAQRFCEYGFSFTFCEQSDDGWWCNCDNGFGFTEYNLNGGDDVDACGIVSDLCAAGPVYDPNTPAMCSPAFTNAGPGYCGVDVECNRSQVLEGGVTANSVEWRNTYCSDYGDSWECDCSVGSQYARLQLPAGQASPQVCTDVMELCSSGPIEPTGEAECSPRFQSADREYCDVELECAQSANLSGQTVSVIGYQHAGCQHLGGGEWDCWCDGFGDASSFTLSSDNAWETCDMAGERCAGQ